MKKILLLVLVSFSYVCESSCTRTREAVSNDVCVAIYNDDAKQIQDFLARDIVDVNDRSIFSGMSLLHVAISHSKPKTAMTLFEQGASLNTSCNFDKRTPWHDLLLVSKNWWEIQPNFFKLVGDNLTVVDIAGKTPLYDLSRINKRLNIAAALNVAVALKVQTQNVLGSAA